MQPLQFETPQNEILLQNLQRLLPNTPLLLLNQVFEDNLQLFGDPRRSFLASLRDPRLSRWVQPKLIAIFEIRYLYPNLPYKDIVPIINRNWIPGNLEESIYRTNYQIRSQTRAQRTLGRATVQRR